MSHAFERAYRSAETASVYRLPDALELYRTPTETLSQRIVEMQRRSWWTDSNYLKEFAAASSFASMLQQVSSVTQELNDAARNISALSTINLSLGQTRQFLEGAGLSPFLHLPNFPKYRRLTAAERRRKLTLKLQGKTESKERRRAKKLIHQYELLLVDTIDDCMSVEYGSDWPVSRLKLCDCKSLIGKHKKRGGHILDHADWTDYAKIMSYPEHFDSVFSTGFQKAGQAYELLVIIGNLRAASHHPRRKFEPDDLKSLTVALLTLKKALTALEPSFEFATN